MFSIWMKVENNYDLRKNLVSIFGVCKKQRSILWRFSRPFKRKLIRKLIVLFDNLQWTLVHLHFLACLLYEKEPPDWQNLSSVCLIVALWGVRLNPEDQECFIRYSIGNSLWLIFIYVFRSRINSTIIVWRLLVLVLWY